MKYKQFHQYDRYPVIPLKGDIFSAVRGWKAVLSELLRRAACPRHVLVCELYPGVDRKEFSFQLSRLSPDVVIDTDKLLLPRDILFSRLYEDQGNDRVFGCMTRRRISDCFDPDKLESARRKVASMKDGLAVVFGTGASLVARGDTLLYANITRWEIQLRYRTGQGNWGLDNDRDPLLTKYKYGYFVLWRIADLLKESLLPCIDLMMDADTPDDPKMITGTAYRAALALAARRPFRTQPYFDPGVWGGQWLRNTLGIPADKGNLAWGFDGVPEENALGFRIGDIDLAFPCIDLVLMHPHELLGERVHGRFGAEFPIRFDFLDTMEGGNLSLQVHPLTEYIQRTFGMHYTQDESYYIMDADEEKNPVVFLGVKTGICRENMVADLEKAQAGGSPFDANKYINCIPVRKHDHLLIPAGTIHCSGADTVVLEISATPYIFTFKLWDWGRLGMDGLPRPIHLKHGLNNIQWDRDTGWVAGQLVNHTETICEADGVLIERTGLHPREFLETIRYSLSRSFVCDCHDSVHMLNLVEGTAMWIDSPDSSFESVYIHYAETVIIPACVGSYRLRPANGVPEIIVIDASVR